MMLDTVLPAAWSCSETTVIEAVRSLTESCLKSYEVHPQYVVEHTNIERATAQGGYGRRQIYELVQNAADALAGYADGRIHVRLTERALYCANEGDPIDAAGVQAILSSHVSMKRGTEIGRFGLGFKSVLGVTADPEFYSRSGSFGFDAERSAQEICRIVSTAERTPTLRLAWELDPLEAASNDPLLADLMTWATTVIKLPRSASESRWLSADLASFPAEFLLFSSHVGSVLFEDATKLTSRHIRLERDGELVRLVEGRAASTWRIFRTDHKPSRDASKDGGELADRESLPIMWAVPVEGRAGRGRFWAFFPTEYVTTLSGILNAPWKTNEDRQNLLTGEFNSELLEVASHLVVGNLHRLSPEDDPARFLDLLPGRGREAPQWADAELTESIYQIAADHPSIPDQTGQLRRPQELHLHPAGLERELVQQWSAHPRRPTDWCHPSVETRERRSRAERLFELAGRSAASIEDWLEALVPDGDVEASAAAIRLAAAIVEHDESWWDAVERSEIVLTTSGAVLRAQAGVVFLPPGDDTLIPDGLAVVHSALAADGEIRAALVALGIAEVDAASEFEQFLSSRYLETLRPEEWTRFWALARRMPERALEILRAWPDELKDIQVKTKAGRYRLLRECLLPGDVVPADGSRDADLTIDTVFHATEVSILTALGARSGPVAHGLAEHERHVARYTELVKAAYLKALPVGGTRPREDRLGFEQVDGAGPIDPLFELSPDSNVRYTERLLAAAVADAKWVYLHRTQPHYPRRSFEPASMWAVRAAGLLDTSLGPRRVGECVGPGLGTWRDVLPVAVCDTDIAGVLGLADALTEVPTSLWHDAIGRVESLSDERRIGEVYAIANQFIDRPARLRCRVGDGFENRAPELRNGITVITEEQSAIGLIHFRTPFITVSTAAEAKQLIDRWDLRAAPQTDLTVQAVPSGPEVPLLDIFSALDVFLEPARQALEIVPCMSIRLEILTYDGKLSDERLDWLADERLYVSDQLQEAALLDAIVAALDLSLSASDRALILRQRLNDANVDRIGAVRDQPTPAAKLLAAVGIEAIRRRLPKGLVTTTGDLFGRLGDVEIAELAVHVYGVELLREFRAELEAAGFHPPQQWAGSRAARRFVRSLGFPNEYAGFQGERRDRILDVDGPPELLPMHDFQQTIAAEIRTLLAGSDVRRGLLSLPTGAGKTRVTVQALIEAMKFDGFVGPVLWIAQSDELCEQAVQSWSYVWRTLGPRSTLRISRLWASNEADSWEQGPHVVVATIQKLQGCIGDEDYEWLTDVTCVVVDEAHLATEPSYTRALEWLGLGRSQRRDRCPLIGLTATPFRGGQEETERLVRRFGGIRLDRNVLGVDAYARLQDMGVLANVDHLLLDGSSVSLSDDERAHAQRMRVLPATAGDRLGEDLDRNDAILNSILEHPTDWTVLLFATSVNHAQMMAALLNREGVSAASISAETDVSARRHYIDEFRAGRLRVLTNYGVLTAGFDAPAVRAVYVARPTFSPVLYQQMIGRGLRGPKNGGKECCLIVNVADNFQMYGLELAFTEFEYLWRGSGGVD